MPAKTNRPTPPSMKAILPKPKSCRGLTTRDMKLGFFSSGGYWPVGLLLGLLLPEKGSCSGSLPCGLSGVDAAWTRSLEADRLCHLPCNALRRPLQDPR